MLNTSGTFNFQSITAEIIIRDAYERIGIVGDLLVQQQLDAASRSLNFLLTEWSNKNVNLWTLQTSFLALTHGTAIYQLPNSMVDVIQVNLRTSVRQNFSTEANPATKSEGGGGNPALAFSSDPFIPGSQVTTNADGWIMYNYGVSGVAPNINPNAQTLTFLGIQTNDTATYPQIIFQGSTDGINFTSIYTIPNYSFTAGSIAWFEIFNLLAFKYYRIIGANTTILNIQKLYFNNLIQDTVMSEVSRYEYLTYPIKHLASRPTVYYVDGQMIQNMYIWPTPSLYYNCISYSWQSMIQDVGRITNAINVPAIFYEALVAGLACKLAIKYKPEMFPMLKELYEESFNYASVKNSEDTPIRLYTDYTVQRYS